MVLLLSELQLKARVCIVTRRLVPVWLLSCRNLVPACPVGTRYAGL